MITVTAHALTALGFNPLCVTESVRVAREKVEANADENKQCNEASELISSLLGVIMPFTDKHRARTTAQAVVETVCAHVGQPLDPEEVVEKARQRADAFVSKPANHWMFVGPEVTVDSSTNVAVASGVEMKVAVKADGKIKKGGKEALAIELYKLHVLDAVAAGKTPLDNQGFIAVLMKELGMTKAGATTYNYNMKKKFGGTITTKPKRVKS